MPEPTNDDGSEAPRASDRVGDTGAYGSKRCVFLGHGQLASGQDGEPWISEHIDLISWFQRAPELLPAPAFVLAEVLSFGFPIQLVVLGGGSSVSGSGASAARLLFFIGRQGQVSGLPGAYGCGGARDVRVAGFVRPFGEGLAWCAGGWCEEGWSWVSGEGCGGEERGGSGGAGCRATACCSRE